MSMGIMMSACTGVTGSSQGEADVTVLPDSATMYALQQQFLDLRFGMFIHYNIPTYSEQDWADPQLPPSVFNPKYLDCNQWAEAAKSANMQYGCLTTKHHSGFCIWDTETTDYNVMNSPLKRDVVKEYADAFRKLGLKVFLYYSILDTHHNIRPGWIKREQTDYIKAQLTELLTNYGRIDVLVIDGWDAGWSRISYEDIHFEEIYRHVKSLQPHCLISEHNAGKYPAAELFYTDIKHYEQNAGQFISKETNQMPAQAGIPINRHWFWKENYPGAPVKSAEFIVNQNLIPLNKAHCNFILNVAPNRDGLIDDNVICELKKIGQLWKHPGKADKLSTYKRPIIESNVAKKKPMNSSWSYDTAISDYANDDNFLTCWTSYDTVEEPYLEVILGKETEVRALGFVEKKYDAAASTRIGGYKISYFDKDQWKELTIEPQSSLIRIHHCISPIKASKVRISFSDCQDRISIAELLVY